MEQLEKNLEYAVQWDTSEEGEVTVLNYTSKPLQAGNTGNIYCIDERIAEVTVSSTTSDGDYRFKGLQKTAEEADDDYILVIEEGRVSLKKAKTVISNLKHKRDEEIYSTKRVKDDKIASQISAKNLNALKRKKRKSSAIVNKAENVATKESKAETATEAIVN